MQRRLKAAGITRTANQFFPEDKSQVIKLQEIRSSLTARWSTSGKGFRARDDANRYAVSEYMKQLGGSSKSKSKYSYSGFEQLVNISSGVVRFFLDPADKMFERELIRHRSLEHVHPGSTNITKRPKRKTPEFISEISTHIQNDLIRKMSNDWYVEELARRAKEKGRRDTATVAIRYQRLKIESIA